VFLGLGSGLPSVAGIFEYSMSSNLVSILMKLVATLLLQEKEKKTHGFYKMNTGSAASRRAWFNGAWVPACYKHSC
jgi:hypothetical protein